MFHCICKLYDNVNLCLHGNYLNTPDMQFSYKRGYLTTLCTLIYKEITHQYKNNGSDVYSCLLDASKAFIVCIMENYSEYYCLQNCLYLLLHGF